MEFSERKKICMDLYHLGKTNVVVGALNRKYMSIFTHLTEMKIPIIKGLR